MDDVIQTLKLVRDGCTWDEIGQQVGKQPATARIRFRRWINSLSSGLTAFTPSCSEWKFHKLYRREEADKNAIVFVFH